MNEIKQVLFVCLGNTARSPAAEYLARYYAEKLGIKGTPAVILPNGVIVPGYKEADALIELIDKSS